MGLNCGIVGLPNVGKSTIFQSLTAAPAEAANYPFCTIEPNIGIVNVPDKRLEKISEIIKPQKTIPAIVEFVDIAGLVAGASKGEGLGNQFLGHIRQVGAIAHIVRCFENDDIVHVNGKIDPMGDIEIINIELTLADLETVQKRLGGIDKLIKSQDKEVSKNAKIAKPILEKVAVDLENGIPARLADVSDEDRAVLYDLHLITMKPTIYVCNVSEDEIENEYVKQVKELAVKENSEVVVLCGKLEAEISQLETEEEKNEFLQSVGLEESGLNQLITAGYSILGLRTYYTAGEKEVRAWTYKEGAKAPEAAGVIHTDFQRGFIKAEVYHCEELFELGSEKKIKEAGRLRIEGKEYVVKDGDVMHFRFNV
ncbi:MAG: redox-regulated ATPase YchF [Bacteriovoracia bacterium]